MMKKIALIASAVALGVGIASIAAECGRYDAVIVNPTGGDDYLRLSGATNVAAKIYMILK